MSDRALPDAQRAHESRVGQSWSAWREGGIDVRVVDAMQCDASMLQTLLLIVCSVIARRYPVIVVLSRSPRLEDGRSTFGLDIGPTSGEPSFQSRTASHKPKEQCCYLSIGFEVGPKELARQWP